MEVRLLSIGSTTPEDINLGAALERKAGGSPGCGGGEEFAPGEGDMLLSKVLSHWSIL